jgi:outer membrane receptor protein involved in Fe transport
VKDLVRDGVPPPGVPVDDVIDAGTVVFREGSTETETTVKYDLTANVAPIGKIQVGASLKRFGLDYDTGAPVGNDSPYSVEPGINPFAVSDRFSAWQTAGYAQVSRDVTPRVNLTAGLRFDDYRILDETRVSPRAGISVRVTPYVSIRASVGRYYQQPFFLFIASFPENASLDPLRADHVVAGITAQMGDTRLAVEAYAKRYGDYPVSTQFPTLSLANVGDTFNVRDVLFPMIGAGRGRVEGVEILVENKSAGRWFGQANASFSRARHAGRDGVLRPGAYDYPVVVNVDGGVRVTPRWTVSTRLAWLGGRPYTPFDEAVSLREGRAIFDLSRVNAERVPDYFRLDLRVERAFGGADRPFVLFAGVQNVTNRMNVSGYSWNRRQNAVQAQEQMGTFPILGFDYRF